MKQYKFKGISTIRNYRTVEDIIKKLSFYRCQRNDNKKIFYNEWRNKNAKK